jgi:hypothetical protein
MHRATLIALIGGAVLVMTVMLMGMINDAGPRYIIGYGGLAIVNMLKMNGSKLREPHQLHNEIEPQQPWDQPSYGAPRFNFPVSA